MKRSQAPGFWPIRRKEKKYVVEPRPGAHRKTESIPLGIILRDILKYAGNMREAKHITTMGMIFVNNKARKDYRYSVGLMDIVHIEPSGETFIVLPNNKGLYLHKTSSNLRLLKLVGKKCIKGRRIQLNFHDGSNVLVDKDGYKTGDVVVFESGKMKEVISMKMGERVMIVSGSNKGKIGTVKNITTTSGKKEISIKIGDGSILVPAGYVFAVGNYLEKIGLQQ